MAVRVRKLARELGRSPAEVLGLLHVLGYTRYKSSEDMISDPVAGKARTAARQGMRAAPVRPEAERKSSRRSTSAGAPDLMAALVPGVAPLSSKAPVAAPRPPAPAPPAEPVPQPVPQPVAEVAPPVDLPDPALERAERELAQARGALEQERAERIAAKAEIERLRTALAARTEPVEPVERAAAGATLADLLEARGLRGADEHARAVEALVAGRRLDPAGLIPTDPDEIARVLADRVVTFDGEVPAGLGAVVGVSVSPDRADAPGAGRLARAITRLGEQLMLCGFKQVRAIGVPPMWHGPLRNLLDSRIDLHLSPGGPRDASRAKADVEGMDVVWLWGVTGDEAAEEAWSDAAVLVRAPAKVGAALEALQRALDAL